MKKYLVIFILFSQACLAQQPVVKDTSFTIQSTFEKEVKKRPYIKIAAPSLSTNINVHKNIPYRNINGRELYFDIFFPKKNKNFPTVLLVFGGGWKSGDKTQNYAMATVLANHGYVAVTAEYRLSGEAIYPAAVYDLKSAIRCIKALAKKYPIDTSKIAVMGVSAGGQLAALIGTTNRNKNFGDTIGCKDHSTSVQAVIDIDGILAFKHPESQEATSASLWLGGDYEHASKNWEQASALNHVDENTVPFLFLNSSNLRFHAGRDDMIAKMKKFNIYSEVHEFPDTPHPFWFFHPWFDPMMKYAIDFLNKTLKNK